MVVSPLIIIGFVLVVAYCYAGGIRASIWTDAIQSCVMIIGSTLLCIVALGEVGGLGGLHASLTAIDPTITSLVPTNRKLGISLWILAFFLGGLGVAGQPQVVSRVMTLGGDKERKEAAIWFFVWQTPFIVIMFIIGLTCRAIFLESTFSLVNAPILLLNKFTLSDLTNKIPKYHSTPEMRIECKNDDEKLGPFIIVLNIE